MAWFHAALPCRDVPQLFFPHHVSSLGEAPTADEMKALAVCRTCPFLAECLDDRLNWEIATRTEPFGTEPFGVCGGLTASQRQAMIRNRKQVAV